MLKPQENERVTAVGPGTPMGNVMRRYWQPAALATELPENDGAPIRVRLLGEDLIAFRGTDGKVGLVDAFCPHRRAPMFFGRNEECGLRCVYHGWKFDASGACVDMPSEPPVPRQARDDNWRKTKVTINAYPTHEAGGVIWAYLGPKEQQPAPPDYEWMRVPATHGFVSKTYEACNWLQGLEGGIDTSHSSFLHNEKMGDRSLIRNRDGAPRLDVERTDYGFSYSSIRNLGDDGTYVRIYHYVMPAQQMRGSITALAGGREKVPKLDGHLWIPIDDHNTYVYNWICAYDQKVELSADYVEWWEHMCGRGNEDLLPGFKTKRNKDNDYLIDRTLQKAKTFTGITGINTQDIALQEGMGTVVDRSKEHLGTSDRAIIAARALLLEAADDVEAGRTPRGVEPETHRDIRPYDDIVPPGKTWRESFGNEVLAKW